MDSPKNRSTDNITELGARLQPFMPDVALISPRAKKIQSFKRQLEHIQQKMAESCEEKGELSDQIKQAIKQLLLDLVTTQCKIYAGFRITPSPSKFGVELDTIRITLLHAFHQDLAQDAKRALTNLKGTNNHKIAMEYRLKAVAWGTTTAALSALHQPLMLDGAALPNIPASINATYAHSLHAFNPQIADRKATTEKNRNYLNKLANTENILGSGTFGEVIFLDDTHKTNIQLAMDQTDKSLNYISNMPQVQPCVVKRSRPALYEQDYQRILIEKQFLEQLNHANIVTYYGYFEHDFKCYLVLECCFQNLSQYPKDDATEMKNIITSIITGLCYLHGQNIVHCDLKPGNILLTYDKEGKLTAKITDFDTAQHTTDSCAEAKGTVSYLTPHNAYQWFMKQPGYIYDFSFDQWAFLVLVYRITTKDNWPIQKIKSTDKEIAQTIFSEKKPTITPENREKLDAFNIDTDSLIAKFSAIAESQRQNPRTTVPQNNLADTQALSAIFNLTPA